MATWSDLLDELNDTPVADRGHFITETSRASARRIAERCDRNVLYYSSAFLQKPEVPGLFTAINREDINGFMAGVHGCDFSKGLLLILHTPGGLAEAAQTIVDYLRSKFRQIDVLIPTYAMSAGTMIALGCDRVIMGRQSQLGPTDPQLIVADRAFSAHSIVAQFDEAKREITGNPVLAHAWAPVLRSFGPALLEEARQALAYGQDLVQGWLQRYMFAGRPDALELAEGAAEYFGGQQHRSHGRRIDRDEARNQNLSVVDLEDDQSLQDEALTLYHLSTILYDQGPALKSVLSSTGQLWAKNLAVQQTPEAASP